ncbi:MAG: Bax inhibitor-1/YccA family protein [Anaerolineae bacterium]
MGVYNPQTMSSPITQPSVAINSVMKLVYVWMSLGMLATAGVAWFTATNDALAALRTSPVVMILSLVVLFGSVIALSVGMTRNWLTPNLAAFLFFVFAGINGFTLSLTLQYFVENEPGALTSAFGTTTILFGTMSIFGFTTRMDLTKLGTYLFMGLIGLVIAMVFNWFIGSSALAFLISFIGVVIFTGLTAYDTQKIKEMSMSPQLQGDGNLVLKFSILGALTLYLDFLNLFLFLLQLFGGSRD